MATANLENSTPTFHEDQNLIAGRYRTHARIGHGRLGEIFTAIDEGAEEPGVEPHLAIQTISQSVVRNNRLFNKINLGYTLLRGATHPNIVNFRHFGRDGKSGYLVMDLLDGLSLRSVLDEAEILTLDEAKPVIVGVGEALRLLHAQDMVHGNLTTSNVFITEELEVRLLDVLPLDSDEPFMRDTATSKPFNGCTIEDDVFDLACLAYEMLAGKHPFNHNPAEARLAGLEADRIASLSASEWSALRRALSLDRAQRTSSIENFMRDFGIRGTERLSPTTVQPATPAQSAATPAPVAIAESAPWEEKRPTARPVRKRARPLRTVFLGVLLAGLSAWSFYGQPQENIADFISYVDERFTVGQAERTAPAATGEVVPADIEAKPSEPERTATTEEIVAVSEDTIEEIVADSEGTNAAPAPMQAESELDFIEPIVSVSERDGAARVSLLRTENLAIPLIWWTSEHTANADTDFIAVEQQTMADAPIGDSITLFVPLVNDDLPEAPESFFVNFGLRNNQQGQVERIAIVRVDINDDDLP